jgi:hypothetical protein
MRGSTWSINVHFHHDLAALEQKMLGWPTGPR